MKKLFSIVTTVALLAGMLPVANGAVSYSDELTGAYDYAYGMGITTMSSIDNADMYGNLTRIALAKMISNYVKELGLQTADTSKACSFTDVSADLDAQYANGVTSACQLGLMGVGISAFRPNDKVTRAEFGTVLSRALWGDANDGGTPYYAYHLNALKDAGIMSKIDDANATEVRGYVMLMMQRADETGANKPAICQTPENVLACSLELDSCPAECKATEVAKPGLATVSLVGSAATNKVPQNVKSYKVGTIKLTAGENDTTVSSIVVTRSNLGTPTAVTSMQFAFAKDGTNATLASTAMSNSTQSKTLRFSPSIVLKAGESVDLDLLVTLNETSANQNSIHDFAVTAVNVVDGTANGTPVKVGTVETTSYSAGAATLNSFADGTIVVGKTDQTVTTVELSANRDYTVKGFTITKDAGPDYDDAMADVKAYYNGSVVGNVIIDAEKITVSNLNIDKLNGETASIELKARGTYIGNDSVITGSITTDDQFVVEKSSGFPMSASAAKTARINLSNIDITLQKSTTGSTTVTPGASSIKLFEAVISSNAEFDVSNWSVTSGGALISGNFVDNLVTVYVNGVDYEMGDAGLNKSLTADRFRVGPSDPVTVKIVGNLKSTASTGQNYKFQFAINAVKNISNGQTVTFASPRTVLGDTVTVGNGGYTITKPTSIPSNKTIMEGNTVDVAFFNMRANSENQVLKNIGIASVGKAFSGYASKVALMQGSTELKSFTSEADLSGTALLFDNLSQTLTKDTTTPFTIRVTLRAGEVTSLGTSIQVNVGTGYVVRSSSQSTRTATTSSAIDGKSYQIASNLPSVALPAQDGKNTTVSFVGVSNYDIQIISGSVEFTRNLVNGSYVNWNGYVQVLDSINGSTAGSTGTVPGLANLTFTNLMLDSSEAQRVLELVDPSNTVTDADYTVTVKNVTFQYIDKNDNTKKSAVITESYNVAK